MRMQCECGCGDDTKGGDFLPGHDQRLRAEIERRVGGLLKLRRLVELQIGAPIMCERSGE
ncbi:hypothetical protein [Flavimaricola marinus]|uniref:Uncharacterized protein n=1 Tax=Flavimaricola marinus TaxID=1819565 RepID=A0A238LC91_9RHOB|nr:hypothetical protein [Flavimaricola marinus]SMY06540.1 hypothetical protein LOM8899_00667 [Flavimaricola marinus]